MPEVQLSGEWSLGLLPGMSSVFLLICTNQTGVYLRWPPERAGVNPARHPGDLRIHNAMPPETTRGV